MNWTRNHTINLLTFFGSIIIVFLILEVILRFTSFGALVSSARSLRYYYKSDENLGFDISKNATTTNHEFADAIYPVWGNELGCFDEPYKGEKPYSILVGDSFTWGFTPFSDKWGTLMQDYIGQRILKCGVSGYGTKQQVQKTKNILTTNPYPKTIIVGYYENDENDDFIFPNKFVVDGWLVENQATQPGMQFAENYCIRYKPAHPVIQYIKCFFRRNSIIYLLTQSFVKSLIPKQTLQQVGIVNVEPGKRVADDTDLSKHFENIKQFKTLARNSGANLLFVIVPEKSLVTTNATTTTYNRILPFLEKEEIEYYYPIDDFRKVSQSGKNLFWAHDIHLNLEGNHLLGQLVSKYILSKKYDYTRLEKVNSDLKKEFSL